MSKEVLHVVPHGEGWAVKKEGNERASSNHDTQKNAIDSARELATEGDDIVVHRTDGTIRDRSTYNSANGTDRSERNSKPEAQDVWSTGTRIRWSPILAGVATALACATLLTTLATAVGLTTMRNMSADVATTSAGVAWFVILMASLFAGGYIATLTTTRETKFEAIIIGVLVWAAALAVSGIGMAIGANTALDATRTASQIKAEKPFWDDFGWDEARARQRLGTLSPDEEKRFNDYTERTRQAASSTDPRTGAWWLFGGMALSVAACIGGALVGAGPDVTRRTLHNDTAGNVTPSRR